MGIFNVKQTANDKILVQSYTEIDVCYKNATLKIIRSNYNTSVMVNTSSGLSSVTFRGLEGAYNCSAYLELSSGYIVPVSSFECGGSK